MLIATARMIAIALLMLLLCLGTNRPALAADPALESERASGYRCFSVPRPKLAELSSEVL